MQVLPSLLDLSTEQLIHLHQMQVGVTLGKFFDRIFKPAAVEQPVVENSIVVHGKMSTFWVDSAYRDG